MHSQCQAGCKQRIENCSVQFDRVPPGSSTMEPHEAHSSKVSPGIKNDKKDSGMIRKDKMVEAVCNNNSKNLFEEVCKMNASKRSSTVSVDGMTDDNDIFNVFGDK